MKVFEYFFSSLEVQALEKELKSQLSAFEKNSSLIIGKKIAVEIFIGINVYILFLWWGVSKGEDLPSYIKNDENRGLLLGKHQKQIFFMIFKKAE